MKETRATTRYARSFAELATEQGQLEQVYADMNYIQKVCNGNRELSILLNSPVIKTDKKQAILKQIFQENVSKLTASFLHLITAKRREPLLSSIAESFIQQYKVRKKILTAVITTASGLDEDIRKKVLALIQSGADSNLPDKPSAIELIEKINENLLGGFVLTVGDKRVDASIATQVKRLAMSFSENPYIKEY